MCIQCFLPRTAPSYDGYELTMGQTLVNMKNDISNYFFHNVSESGNFVLPCPAWKLVCDLLKSYIVFSPGAIIHQCVYMWQANITQLVKLVSSLLRRHTTNFRTRMVYQQGVIIKLNRRNRNTQQIHSLLLSQMVSPSVINLFWYSIPGEVSFNFVNHRTGSSEVQGIYAKWIRVEIQWLSKLGHLCWLHHIVSFARKLEVMNGWWEAHWVMLDTSHTAPLHPWLQHWVLTRSLLHELFSDKSTHPCVRHK